MGFGIQRFVSRPLMVNLVLPGEGANDREEGTIGRKIGGWGALKNYWIKLAAGVNEAFVGTVVVVRGSRRHYLLKNR